MLPGRPAPHPGCALRGRVGGRAAGSGLAAWLPSPPTWVELRKIYQALPASSVHSKSGKEMRSEGAGCARPIAPPTRPARPTGEQQAPGLRVGGQDAAQLVHHLQAQGHAGAGLEGGETW